MLQEYLNSSPKTCIILQPNEVETFIVGLSYSFFNLLNIMFLTHKETGVLVEVQDAEVLINPSMSTIKGRVQSGEEEQDPEQFSKEDLIFPSGETLPKCWVDADYRNQL